MSSIIVFLLCIVIGYTLVDIFEDVYGNNFSVFKDIRYWIIILSVAGIHLIDLNM